MAEVIYNGQKYSTESDIGKLASQFEQPGYRPDAPQNRFPRMMYKAQKGADGVVRCDAGQGVPRHYFQSDAAYEASVQKDDSFNASCRLEVGRGPDGLAKSPSVCEAEYKAALENGWRDSAEDAIALCIHYETIVLGTAHAERQHRDKGMSEKAKAEAAAVDASVPDILAEIPEAPLVKKPAQYDNPGSVKVDKRTKAYKAAQKS